jgi:hypothetical protein
MLAVCLKIPIISLLLLPALQWALVQWRGEGLPQRQVALLCAALTIGATLAAAISLRHLAIQMIGEGAAYVFLVTFFFGNFYFHLFNMALTARRIQLLIRMIEGKGSKNGSQAEASDYDGKKIIDLRIQRLISLGSLHEKNGRFHARTGILLLASLVLEKGRWLFYGSQ